MKNGLVVLLSVLSIGLKGQVDSVWQAYYDSSDVYYYKWDMQTAIDWLNKGRDHLIKTVPNPESDSTYNLTLNDLGICYKLMGRYEEALPFYLEALENTAAIMGKQHSSYGIRLKELGILYESMGRYEEALPLYLEALENMAASLGKQHPYFGMGLSSLGNLYRTMGRYKEALPPLREALEVTAASLGKEHSFYGTVLSNLAFLYQSIGRYEDVLPLLHEALENTTVSLGKQHPSYGIILNNLGYLYHTMGQYEEALPLLQEALEHAAASLGKKHSIYGQRLANLGSLYHSMGRYQEALTLYLEALENAAASVGIEHSDYGVRLNDLGLLYLSMGRYEEAILLYSKALENITASLGKQHKEYGNCLNNLGSLYLSIGRYEEALPILQEALENTATSLGKQHKEYGIRLNNLGRLYQSMSRYEEALPLLQGALENTAASLGKKHSNYGALLNNLGLLYRSMGRCEEALPLYFEANANLMGQVEQIFSISNEKNKQDFLKTINSRFDQYQSLAYSSDYQFDSLNIILYNNSLWQKGLVLNSTTQTTNAIRESGDSVLLAKFEDWRNLRNQLARQYSKPIDKRMSGLDSLEQVANAWEEELVRGSTGFASSREKINWQEVRDLLNKGEVAIEFVHFRYTDKQATDSIFYAAMILTPDCRRPEIIPIFEEKQFTYLLSDRLVASTSLSINDFYRGAKPLINKSEINQTALYNLIWEPIEEYLTDVENIYYVPSGQLHQVSMAAILHPEGGKLSDHYNLIELASTRNLVVGSEEPYNQSISLFGGIEYDFTMQLVDADTLNDDESMLAVISDFNQRSALMEKFTFLPGTATEVKNIQTLFGQNQITTKLSTGQSATEASFKSLSGNSPDVIHIATHGFFFPDVEYTAEEIERGAAFKYLDNPMFRAGLVFAGANYTWEHGYNQFQDEDGILTAYEISNMDLTNTDLVVLSACETGLGDIKGSEGVFGLQRAFKMAGVDYLIMSLWQVPDKETKEFMVMFYEKWLGGMNIRNAFLETQRTMSARYPNDPYKWAAFVLVE